MTELMNHLCDACGQERPMDSSWLIKIGPSTSNTQDPRPEHLWIGLCGECVPVLRELVLTTVRSTRL